MSPRSTQRRGLAAERLLAQLRWTPGDPERAVERRPRPAHPGAARARATYAGAPVARTSAVPKRSRLGGDELDRARPRPSPRARAAPPRSITATIWGSAAKRASVEDGSGAAQTTASSSHESRQRRTSPAGSPSRASAMPPTSSRARSSRSPRRGRGSASRASASSSRASVFGPIPGTVCSRPAAAASRSSSGVRMPSARAISTERLAPEAEIATEADEAGRELALELGQLGDVAGLDELAQPRLDPAADPAQLAHPAAAHELGDRDAGARADRLGRAAVGAGRVRVRVGELEQRRERVQPVGDLALSICRAGAATGPAAA